MSQKDRTVDFASNISLKVSIYSDTNSNLFASNIGQKLNPGRTFIILFIDILLKKSARRLKINI